MDRRDALKLFAGFALCPLCTSSAFRANAHWSYQGGLGPERWGDLDAAYRACSGGAQQSPLDIDQPVRAQLSPLQVAWAKRADTIVNNGHTIQLNVTDGSTLTAPAGSYKLLQFHFHRPSEHMIGGKSFPMEAHFVHANAAGALAVVGVLMAAGRPNVMFNKIVSTMPQDEGPTVKADPGIDPNGLLPPRRNYFRYSGSLTTPPCSETVDWLVLTDPIQVADADIARFAKLYPMNARPVQKLDRRFVLRSG
jgi:carbonic anhydrase